MLTCTDLYLSYRVRLANPPSILCPWQNEKHARIREHRRLTGDYNRGFLTSGLFRYSRHPNFFAGAWRTRERIEGEVSL